MDKKQWLAAVAMIGLGVVWIGYQRSKLLQLERQTAALVARGNAGGSGEALGVGRSKQIGYGPGKSREFGWVDFFAQGRTQYEKQAGERSSENLRVQLTTLPVKEICRGLDEMEKAGLPANVERYLASIFYVVLADKDPETALNRFIDRASKEDHGGGAQWLEGSMKALAANDLTKATAWLDRIIAEGKLANTSLHDSNPIRVNFETTVIKEMLSTDREAVKIRLNAMSEDEAAGVFSHLFSPAAKSSPVDVLAGLVRETLPDDRQLEVIASMAERTHSSLPDVSSFMEKIQATPPEAEACIVAAGYWKLKAAEGFASVEEIDATRAWADGCQPGAADKMTGLALARAVSSSSFTRASELALHYHAATGNDQILADFLSGDARFFGSSSLEIAEKIKNPDMRAAVIKKIR